MIRTFTDNARAAGSGERRDRAGAPDVEGALPAHPDRGVHALAARRRHALRPLAPDPRARRRRDHRGRAAVDGDPGAGDRLGGVDGHAFPGGRRVRLSRSARDARRRGRDRHARRAERLGAATASSPAARPGPSSTTTSPSRSSERTASSSSASSSRGSSATSRSVVARRCRNEPSNGPCLRAGSSRMPRDGHSAASGHISQRGMRARHTVAPRSMSACAAVEREGGARPPLHALDVDVHREHVLAEREAADRRRGVRPDARKLREVVGPAALARRQRRAVEVEPAAVVAEPLPLADDVAPATLPRAPRRSASARARRCSAGRRARPGSAGA